MVRALDALRAQNPCRHGAVAVVPRLPAEPRPAMLLRAMDALVSSRRLWLTELSEYATCRRAAKRLGQRSARATEFNASSPTCWYGDSNRAAIFAVGFKLNHAEAPTPTPTWFGLHRAVGKPAVNSPLRSTSSWASCVSASSDFVRYPAGQMSTGRIGGERTIRYSSYITSRARPPPAIHAPTPHEVVNVSILFWRR
jgi:hypothetical protein